MSREAHVRICEGVGVRFPHATRPFYPVISPATSIFYQINHPQNHLLIAMAKTAA